MTKHELINRLNGQQEYELVLRLAGDRISEDLPFATWLTEHGYGYRVADGEIELTGTWMMEGDPTWPVDNTWIRAIRPVGGVEWLHLSSPYGDWTLTELTDEASGEIVPHDAPIQAYWDCVPDVDYDANSVDFLGMGL